MDLIEPRGLSTGGLGPTVAPIVISAVVVLWPNEGTEKRRTARSAIAANAIIPILTVI
jgi:hypothetical protein